MSRPVQIPGLSNVRDLGGMSTPDGPVRDGVIFRADAPIRLPEAGGVALRGLGLAKVIDLREPIERRHDPADTERMNGNWGALCQLPLFDGAIDLRELRDLDSLYRDAIDGCGERFVTVLGEIRDPDGTPALVHCSAGKDRTGLVVALLLEAIGTSRDEVVADYAMTAQQMAGPAIKAVQQRALRAGIPEQHLAQALGSPPEVMVATLDHVDERYGGAAAYLIAHGAEPSAIDELGARLVV